MDLQNISINFTDSSVSSYYENTIWSISGVSNLPALLTELDSATSFTVLNAVVQYTEDQHHDVPRVVMNNGSLDPLLLEVFILPLSDASAGLTAQLDITKIEVEADITIQKG